MKKSWSVIYIYYMLFLIVQISVSKTTKSFFDTYLYNYLKRIYLNNIKCLGSIPKPYCLYT